jgi:hypothetical protein
MVGNAEARIARRDQLNDSCLVVSKRGLPLRQLSAAHAADAVAAKPPAIKKATRRMMTQVNCLQCSKAIEDK